MKLCPPLLLFLTLLLSLSNLSCRCDRDKNEKARSQKIAPIVKAISMDLATLLPARKMAQNFVREGEAGIFGPQNIEQLLNGGAGLYKDRGFKKAVSAQYNFVGKGTNAKVTTPGSGSRQRVAPVVVTIFDMTTPRGATSIFAQEKAKCPKSVWGQESYICPNQLVFTLTNLYIRVDSFAPVKANRLYQFASYIVEKANNNP